MWVIHVNHSLVFVLFVSGIFVLNYYQTSKDEKVEEVGVESLTQTWVSIEDAINIAEEEWIGFYWKKAMDEQKPLKAILKDGNWVVTWTLSDGMVWWVIEVTLSEKDGKVINVIHWK